MLENEELKKEIKQLSDSIDKTLIELKKNSVINTLEKILEKANQSDGMSTLYRTRT